MAAPSIQSIREAIRVLHRLAKRVDDNAHLKLANIVVKVGWDKVSDKVTHQSTIDVDKIHEIIKWLVVWKEHLEAAERSDVMITKLPKGLTIERVAEAVRDDEMVGFCLSCGEMIDRLEPDARNTHCESCGSDNGFGAEEVLMMIL